VLSDAKIKNMITPGTVSGIKDSQSLVFREQRISQQFVIEKLQLNDGKNEQ
jgi:hypothetical protein